jgi:hypothetical protein
MRPAGGFASTSGLVAAAFVIYTAFLNNSVAETVMIWLRLLGVAAGVVCAALLAGLGVASVTRGRITRARAGQARAGQGRGGRDGAATGGGSAAHASGPDLGGR